MKIRVLGCSGAVAHGCHTTAFLIDDDVLIDAGTGVADLPLADLRRIDHVFLTHVHMDHIAALPLLLDAVGKRATPLQVHGLSETLAALHQHVFNGVIWPDFSRIPHDQPLLQWRPLAVGEVLPIHDSTGRVTKRIEALPARHAVPAVGYAVQKVDEHGKGGGYWVFSGDSAPHEPFWQRINQLDVRHLVVEAAFSNAEQHVADLSQHMTPHTLMQALQWMAPDSTYPLHITHLKPADTAHIMLELDRLNRENGHRPHDLRWLQSGQEMIIE